MGTVPLQLTLHVDCLAEIHLGVLEIVAIAGVDAEIADAFRDVRVHLAVQALRRIRRASWM